MSASGAVLALASLSNVTTNRNYSICFLLFKEVRASDTVTFLGGFVEAVGAVLALASLCNATTYRNYHISLSLSKEFKASDDTITISGSFVEAKEDVLCLGFLVQCNK